MTFLQPWLLAALPIITLPVIVHLINQRRFQTVDWGAMRFLLEANRMSRGYARIRQWLILLSRVLALAALVFVISRPLASGWLGLTAGGKSDTTLILIDRSPSMQQLGTGTSTSKLETGVAQLVQALSAFSSSHWVVIDSATLEPLPLESPRELLELPSAQGNSASADLPAMLQAAHDYIRENRTGDTQVWICSDLRANDWNATSGRWKGLRDSFAKFRERVRFHLLAYPAQGEGNIGVRVTRVERRSSDDGAALQISLRLLRSEGAGKLRVPIQFEINGARSELLAELEGHELEINNHRIALAESHRQGWGRVSVPADTSPADNECYFVFDEPAPRRTVLVADETESTHPLELAAAISPDPAIDSEVMRIDANQVASVKWEDVALVLWQAPLPEGASAEVLRGLVARGGQVVFFPSSSPGEEEFLGVRWSDWVATQEMVRVATWRGDQDLLARTQAGDALPVGELLVHRYCRLFGPLTALATLADGAPLLARAVTDRGGVFFCATTSSPNEASLGNDGVVLYVAIQRALAAGAAELGRTRELVAGTSLPPSIDGWSQLAGTLNALSTTYRYHAGVYRDGDRMVCVNRASAEDEAATLSDSQVAGLFRGLAMWRVDDQAGSTSSLAQEIWRLFLGAMLIALVLEAGLCIPRRPHATGGHR